LLDTPCMHAECKCNLDCRGCHLRRWRHPVAASCCLSSDLPYNVPRDTRLLTRNGLHRTMLNFNATAFVPKPFGSAAPVPITETTPPPPVVPIASVPAAEKSTAGSSGAAAEPAADDSGSEAFDADFEEVLNALEELQESQINQEVEEQMMQEMELYESEYDDFIDDDERMDAAAHSTGSQQQHQHQHPQRQQHQQHQQFFSRPHQQSSGSSKCKFAPHCRDGARLCRFSHQHMGACKFGADCHNPACNFMH
jgi:hypothetical protein